MSAPISSLRKSSLFSKLFPKGRINAFEAVLISAASSEIAQVCMHLQSNIWDNRTHQIVVFPCSVFIDGFKKRMYALYWKAYIRFLQVTLFTNDSQELEVWSQSKASLVGRENIERLNSSSRCSVFARIMWITRSFRQVMSGAPPTN